MRVAFVVANQGVDEAELLRPWLAALDAGGDPELVAPNSSAVQTMRGFERSDRFPVQRLTGLAEAADYEAVVLPGGVGNADQLRTDAAAVDHPHGDLRGGQTGRCAVPRSSSAD